MHGAGQIYKFLNAKIIVLQECWEDYIEKDGFAGYRGIGELEERISERYCDWVK